jgi:hypothetical protein
MCVHDFINLFIDDRILVPESLIDWIVKMGISPTSLLQSNVKQSRQIFKTNGLCNMTPKE